MKRVRTQKEGDNRAQSLPMSKKRDHQHSLSLPLDLIIEILTKLPPKSASKLICVSKLWSSIIQSKHFTELYLARSSTRPRLLFQFSRHGGSRFFHSASQENPSSDHRATTIPLLDQMFNLLPPIRGLICWLKGKNLVISNPSTSQFLTLPKLATTNVISEHTFFGYDPVNDLYKVLCITVRYVSIRQLSFRVFSEEHHVFTLGAQKTWRMIECKHPHRPATQGLCKNGVVYYGAFANSSGDSSFLMSFDVSSEEFCLIALPEDVEIKCQYLSGLVNYNGKIALVDQSSIGRFEFLVLEDFTNQEWSKFSVLVPSWNDLAGKDPYRCAGCISTGELVFSPRFSFEFFLIYYDPKEGKARRVEFQIQTDVFIGKTVFLDHVESPMFLPR